jgi:hypothetical protein
LGRSSERLVFSIDRRFACALLVLVLWSCRGSSSVHPGEAYAERTVDPGPRGRALLVWEVLNTETKALLGQCWWGAYPAERPRPGSIEVRFKIDPSGKVIRAGVESSTYERTELASCVAAALRDLRFPPGGAPEEFIERFELVSGSDARAPAR